MWGRDLADSLSPGQPAGVVDPLAPARDAVATTVRRMLTGTSRPPDPSGGFGEPGDPGLHGPDSVSWRVHGDLSMLVGGVRALLLQTLHPLAMAGVAEHSDYRTDPWGRLRRTAAFVGATTYGDTPTALAAVETVKRVHDRVHGVAPDGRPYSAHDPELLTWVHATEVESFLVAFLRHGGRLDQEERNRYLAEQAEVALLLGAPDPPRSVRELQAYLRAVRPELEATPQAHDAVRFLVAPPLPPAARPAYAVLTAGAVELLPLWVRVALRLPLPPVTGMVAARPAAGALLAFLRWSLGPSPAAAAAEARVRRVQADL